MRQQATATAVTRHLANGVVTALQQKGPPVWSTGAEDFRVGVVHNAEYVVMAAPSDPNVPGGALG
jgi:hypothetical protein